MEYKGHVLDKFQEDAIAAIENNNSVVVSAPTGSGKTLIADYVIDRDLKRGVRVIYTAPIKALSNQKYKQFVETYGEENVGMLTGDVSKNPRALILIMTTEIYRNMVVEDDEILKETSYVIFDEIHYINDIERGYVWEESVIFSKPNIRMLCLSATIPNAEEFANWIQAIKGHKVEVIKHHIRPVPLHVSFYDTELGITTLKAIKDIIDIPDYDYVRGKKRERRPRIEPPSHINLVKDIEDQLPCLYFSFSRLGCQQRAEQLANKRLFENNQEITAYVIKKLSTAPPEINKLASTKMLRHTLSQGIAFHHAGLLPIMKEIVEELFAKGLIKVLYTTETFAVGINMPAKAVCFESLRKFDGRGFRFLDSKEFFQIAGRAGRRGIDKEGFVYALINRFEFDYPRIKHLTEDDKTPLTSQFKLSVNTVLNMIRSHTPLEIDEILCKSFYSYQKYGVKFSNMRESRSHREFENHVAKLQKLGYLEGDMLTEKGEFAAKIYADEIITTEIFGTDFGEKLDSYQLLLCMACICFEGGSRAEFRKKFKSEPLFKLREFIKTRPYVKLDVRFNNLDDLTALMHPVWNKKSFFDILDNSSLLEGDIVRFFRQILDRLSQIKHATNNIELQKKIDECEHNLEACLGDIDAI